jgi:hypothetical protein
MKMLIKNSPNVIPAQAGIQKKRFERLDSSRSLPQRKLGLE